MLLKEFPDISMVRRLRNEPLKPTDKWMNVALNIKCREASRTGVESPYSLFINRKGFSYCTVNRQQYRIETNAFLFTQPGDIYDLIIDNTDQTEICNIHINREFFNNAAYSLTTSSSTQLDKPYHPDDALHFFTQLHEKDEVTKYLIAQLSKLPSNDTANFERLLIDIIENLLIKNQTVRSKISRLPFLKGSVREDIYRRLATARDYIHSNYEKAIDLDDISIETGMSKFHFLRMFRIFYGITPYQYLSDIRMKKAADLLETTNSSINEIAASVGFEYPNSLIKAFRKTYNIAPHQYRKLAI